MRDSGTHHRFLQEVNLTNKPNKGVKGSTKLSAILNGLSLTAAVDSTHQVNLALSKVLLGFVVRKTATIEKKDLDPDDLAASIEVTILVFQRNLD